MNDSTNEPPTHHPNSLQNLITCWDSSKNRNICRSNWKPCGHRICSTCQIWIGHRTFFLIPSNFFIRIISYIRNSSYSFQNCVLENRQNRSKMSVNSLSYFKSIKSFDSSYTSNQTHADRILEQLNIYYQKTNLCDVVLVGKDDYKFVFALQKSLFSFCHKLTR